MRSKLKTRRSAGRIILAVAACAIALAGCSSSGNKSSGSNSGGSSGGATSGGASSSASGSTGLTAAQIQWAVQYTGGTTGAANPALAPITLGYVNQQGGTLSFPDATAAFNATLKFMNEHLGGIDGHPVTSDQCLAAGPDDTLKCGNQMANNPKVKAIVIPLLLLNNQAFYQAVGGKKPIIDGNLIFPVDLTTPNVYSFGLGGEASAKGMAYFATKILGGKRVVDIRTDNPAGLAAVQEQFKYIKQYGGTYLDVPVPEPGTAPQYVAAIRAANIKQGDVVDLSITSVGGVSVYDALKTLNIPSSIPILGSELQALPPMPGHLKDVGAKYTVYPDNWYMQDAGYTALMPAPNSNGTDVYVAMMGQYAPSTALIGYGPTAFQSALEMAKFITAAGGADATSDQIAAQIKAFTGPAVMVAGPIKCGANASEPNACASTIGYEQFKGGQWISIVDGLNGKAINTLTI